MSLPEPGSPASPGELMRAFSSLALQGFGGVLPVAKRELVERRGWLTREQFVEALSIGQGAARAQHRQPVLDHR